VEYHVFDTRTSFDTTVKPQESIHDLPAPSFSDERVLFAFSVARIIQANSAQVISEFHKPHIKAVCLAQRHVNVVYSDDIDLPRAPYGLVCPSDHQTRMMSSQVDTHIRAHQYQA
jgi:hypothetical protein